MAKDKERWKKFGTRADEVVVVLPNGSVANPEVYRRYEKKGGLPKGLKGVRRPVDDE